LVPTPSMRERDPSLPAYVAPGPENPLGVRAMHLTWQYYRIHGTGDTRKIGRKSSSGCIGLHNEDIIEVFDRTPIGTQVKLI
jgi:L,D-transpeptidase ErfK/SrfK